MNLLTDLKPTSSALRVMPLGGLGEIGMNCMLFEFDGEIIMVDCGQMMPDEEMLGVDYVIPDITYLLERPSALKAILLTHAHEDHVGALPYILPQFGKMPPVYGSRFTIALLKEKFREHGFAPDFHELEARVPVDITKNFSLEPIAVTHSMINAFAFAIRTPVGTVIHSGDFKIDPNPPDGVAFDHYAFAKYAEQDDGVLLLMSDSTNSDRTGSCPSEIEVIPGIRRILREAEGTVIISTFASSLHRIQTVLNLAAECGREVVSVGLNMQRNIRVASELGLIDIPCDYSDEPRRANRIAPHKKLILCTGSQGEPMSSLSRMSNSSHRDISVSQGDTIVLSARIIPGNEVPIFRMANRLSRLGANVITESMARIHVSGHAYRDEMKHLINLTDPAYLVPVHGEYRHLHSHAALARELHFEDDEIFVLENGDCLELDGESAEVIGKIPHGRTLVDGKGIDDVNEVVLRDRHFLSQDGMVVAIVGMDRETGDVLSGPEIITRGFVHVDESAEQLDALKQQVLDAVLAMPVHRRTDFGELQQEIKRTIRRSIKKDLNRFPVVLPVVMEL
ncbi:MAG: ribonuclease J [Sumerlaeia bacterium]